LSRIELISFKVELSWLRGTKTTTTPLMQRSVLGMTRQAN
jgi:hypothetical protein